MIAWFSRLFHRPRPVAPPVPEPPETPATVQARAAIDQMAATEDRIDRTLAALERERAESVRRINRTGNFAEGWLVPDPRERQGDRP